MGLNHRPSLYERLALTTELQAHYRLVFKVLREGLEPSCPLQAGNFKFPVSAIPPPKLEILFNNPVVIVNHVLDICFGHCFVHGLIVL